MVKEEDNSPFCRKNTRCEATETPGCGHEGIRPTATQKEVQLRCFYTNARSTGNKQEELEEVVWSESYDIVAIMEIWWNDSHSWSAVMTFQETGSKSSGVALCAKKERECVEINDGDDRIESLWVRIKAKASKTDVIMGICYRPSNQDEEVDKTLYKHLGGVSRSLPLVLLGDFNFPSFYEIDTFQNFCSAKGNGILHLYLSQSENYAALLQSFRLFNPWL